MGLSRMNVEILVFCTSYVPSHDVWTRRYERWLDHHAAIPLGKAVFCLIDDSSPYCPDKKKVQTISVGEPLPRTPSRPFLLRFGERLGRSAIDCYPGWWRSFLFSVHIAKYYRCRKILHVESDAFILSRRLMEFIKRISSGWTCFWCPRWNFPETSIQVICEDKFDVMQELWNSGWDQFSGKYAEHVLPFTNVVKNAYGDRYGEFRFRIPRIADFAAQVSASQEVWFR
jgi:hypothetical protein